MLQNGSCCIIDRKFLNEKEGDLGLVEKVESEFEEDDDWGVVERGRERVLLTLNRLRTILIHSIFGSPRIWHPGFNLFHLFERPDELEFPYWAKSFLDRWPREPEREMDFFELFQLMLTRARQEYSEEQDEDEDEGDEAALLSFWESIARYWVRNRFLRENGFFRKGQFIWNPPDPDVFIFKDPALKFLRQELITDEEMSDSDPDPDSESKSESDSESKSESDSESKSESDSWFKPDSWFMPEPDSWFMPEPESDSYLWFKRLYDRREETPKILHRRWSFWDLNQNKMRFKLLISRQRYFRPIRAKSSFFQGSFSSKTRYESLRYLTNLFLSNRTLLDQMIRALLRKRWIFPEEMKHAICVSITGEGFPIP